MEKNGPTWKKDSIGNKIINSRYGKYLFKSKNSKDPVKQSTQYHLINSAKKILDIHCSKSTHLGREYGAVFAAMAGTSADGIKQAGRWNMGSSHGSYLNKQLCVEALRTMSGFDPNVKDYYLPRSAVIPGEGKLFK
jgi:hypothetical protein